MKEKRYYYDDPLAAAWMAKHFGMLFDFTEMRNGYRDDTEDGDYGLKPKKAWSRIKSWKTLCEIGKHAKFFYIHPDSLSILEPEMGDLIDGWASRIGFVEETGKDLCIDVNGGSWECPRESQGRILQYEIIQRNGIAFHWPKMEESDDAI